MVEDGDGGRKPGERILGMDLKGYTVDRVIVDDAIAWLRREQTPEGTTFVEHVPAEIERFGQAGYRVEKTEKDLNDGIDEVRNRLDTHDEDRPGLVVSENCENLICGFLSYKVEQVGTSSAEDHCLEVTRYVCRGEAGSRQAAVWSSIWARYPSPGSATVATVGSTGGIDVAGADGLTVPEDPSRRDGPLLQVRLPDVSDRDHPVEAREDHGVSPHSPLSRT